MNKYTTLFLLSVLPSTLLGQENSINVFKYVESNCYCKTTESTPNAILKMDNNWEIVYSLTSPKSITQMDSSGLEYTSSQLKLLQQWRLIAISSDGIYKTSIPIFDSIKTSALRTYSKRFSVKLVPLIANYVINLKKQLKAINRDRNIYSILFSYVLDGMVWERFDADSLLSNREITIEKPFWAGEYWLLYPKRTFFCGTNTISEKGYSIKVNWSEKAIPHMIPFVSRWDLLEKILNDLISKNKVDDNKSIEVFAPYNIFDDKGNFTVPVIIENDSNPLYKISGEISGIVNNFLSTEIDIEQLKIEYNLENNSQAIIILYHEMLWDMMDIMESKGLISKPKIFENSENSIMSDVSDLVIITKK